MEISSAIGVTSGGNRRLAWWPESASYAADFRAGLYMRGGEAIGQAAAFSVERETPRLAKTSAGHWQEFEPDTPALTDLGLSVLSAGTNGIRNSSMVGTIAGAPGTVPNHWTFSGGAAGASYEVVGIGTVFGLPYIDIKIFGTTSSASGVAIRFDTHSILATAKDEAINFSCFIGLVGGSTSGFTFIRPCVVEHRANGTNAQTHYLASIRDTLSPEIARLSANRTMAHADTASVRAELELTFASGKALDMTMRIAAPQLEKGNAASIPLLTAGTFGQRGADALTLYLPSGEQTLELRFADAESQTISTVGGEVTLGRAELDGDQLISVVAVPIAT